MLFQITAVYAGLLGLLLLVLSALVIKERVRTRVGLGDGGDDQLTRAIRAQANFAEYVPMTVILIAIVEAVGAPAMAVHTLGAMLLIGRVLHPLGLMAPKIASWPRGLGTLLTFVVLLIAGAGLVAHALF